jgi:membrane protein
VPRAHTADGDWRDSGRGRSAESPRDIPRRGWRDIAWRVKDQIKEDRLSIISAGVAFYGLLAIFPALIALVAIYGLAFDPQQVEQHVASLSAMLPEQAKNILLEQLHSLTSTGGTALGFGAIAGIVLALWSASAGVRTLMEALNVAYDEEEDRGVIRFYGTALLLTLGAIFGVLVAIGAVVALPAVINMIGLGNLLENVVSYARWPILALAVILGLAIVYRFGPSRRPARWAWVSPGAVVATVLWIAGSALFSLYVSKFGNYNETYGAMGAVVILLMWFLLSAYAVLIGAEVNAEMERQTRKDTTRGGSQPLGRREAHAADTVGRSA